MVNYYVDDENAAAIAQDLASTEYSHETILELSISNELTVSGAQVIARGLQHSRIRTLYIRCVRNGELNGNHLTNEQDMLAVCAALPQVVSLTDLTICCQLAFDEQPTQAGNVVPHIQATGAEQLMMAIDDDDDEGVPRVDLRLQHVRPTGAEQLMVAVANHPSLHHLTIGGCNDIGFVGLAMIGTHLPNIKLKSLNLDWLRDEYDPYDEDESVKRAFQRACQALVAGVQSNWHLHDLKLPYEIKFPPNVTDKIDFYLNLNKSGRYLLYDTAGEEIPMGLWCHVLAKCGNKAGLIFYHLHEQPALLLAGDGHISSA